MNTTRAAGSDRSNAAVPDDARRRCPHDIDHPRWCPVCHVHWEARMRHPSWPRVSAADRR